MRRLEDSITPLGQRIAEQRPYKCDYDAIIELIENDEPIYREEFRAAALAGVLAPHYFFESPFHATCEECDMVINFYQHKAPAK